MCLCMERIAGRFAQRLENDEESGNTPERNGATFSACTMTNAKNIHVITSQWPR